MWSVISFSWLRRREGGRRKTKGAGRQLVCRSPSADHVSLSVPESLFENSPTSSQLPGGASRTSGRRASHTLWQVTWEFRFERPVACELAGPLAARNAGDGQTRIGRGLSAQAAFRAGHRPRPTSHTADMRKGAARRSSRCLQDRLESPAKEYCVFCTSSAYDLFGEKMASGLKAVL